MLNICKQTMKHLARFGLSDSQQVIIESREDRGSMLRGPPVTPGL